MPASVRRATALTATQAIDGRPGTGGDASWPRTLIGKHFAAKQDLGGTVIGGDATLLFQPSRSLSKLGIRRLDLNVIGLLMGDDLKLLETGRSERSGDRHVCGVAPGRNENPPNPWRVVPCVKGPPTIFQVHFEPGAEVHRRRRNRHTNIAEISGGIARRNI